jgi:hypothetical protein
VADVFQAFLTALAAITVLVLGQIIIKFFIEPADELRKLVGDIADTLIYHSNKITNPLRKLNDFPGGLSDSNINIKMYEEEVKDRQEISDILRQKACLLISKAHLVKGYRIFEKFGVIPKRSSIENASGNLIFLHNRMIESDPLENAKVRDEIFELLNIEYLKKKKQ